MRLYTCTSLHAHNKFTPELTYNPGTGWSSKLQDEELLPKVICGAHLL